MKQNVILRTICKYSTSILSSLDTFVVDVDVEIKVAKAVADLSKGTSGVPPIQINIF